jgi:hypothetical protein
MKRAGAAAIFIALVFVVAVGYLNGPKVQAHAREPFSPTSLNVDQVKLHSSAWEAF